MNRNRSNRRWRSLQTPGPPPNYSMIPLLWGKTTRQTFAKNCQSAIADQREDDRP
jgi:hypothetical protein